MKAAIVAALGAIAIAQPAAADESGAMEKALVATRPILELRLRSENVDQTGLARDAEAVTLRGRFGFETGKAWNTALLAEAELLSPLQSDYNDTVNGKSAFPVVADRETYELNRLQLVNTSLPKTTVTLGRQRINLDDQRFVGSVGWRQNEQTFDALRVANQSFGKWTIDLTYVEQTNRVFGKDSPVGRYEGSSYLANVSRPLPLGTLSGFAYLLDFDQAPADSSATYGVRLAGERPLRTIKLGYAASYARQQDHAGNPLDYRDDYYAAELTGTLQPLSLGGGIEVLEGNGVKGFATPLATLHKFQGWADKFLNTPPNGIEDRYVNLGYARKKVGRLDSLSATAVYHDYSSQRASLDYGSEFDLQLQAKWQRFSALLKYADYRADALATDTGKFWVQLEFVR